MNNPLATIKRVIARLFSKISESKLAFRGELDAKLIKKKEKQTTWNQK